MAIEVAELMVDFFTAGTVRNAVNFPSVSGETLKILRPYIELAEKLGSLQGQMTTTLPTEVTIEYSGQILSYNLAPVTQALLKGLLTPMVSDVSVNYVNAPLVAKERGLKVVESKVSEEYPKGSLEPLSFRSPPVSSNPIESDALRSTCRWSREVESWDYERWRNRPLARVGRLSFSKDFLKGNCE